MTLEWQCDGADVEIRRAVACDVILDDQLIVAAEKPGGDQVRGLEMSDDGHLILKLSREWPDGRVMTGWVRWRRAAA